MRYIGVHEIKRREKLHRVTVGIALFGIGVALSAWSVYGMEVVARIAGCTLSTCGAVFGWATIRYRP